MKRMTREKDEFECRLCRGYSCDELIMPDEFAEDGWECPHDCILMKYANALAAYEDAAARGEIPWLGVEE